MLSAQPTSMTTKCCSRADSPLPMSLAPPFRLLYRSTRKLLGSALLKLQPQPSKHLVVCIKLLFSTVHFVTSENYDHTSSDLESSPSLDGSPKRMPAYQQSVVQHPASPVTQYVFHNIKRSLCINHCIISVN